MTNRPAGKSNDLGEERGELWGVLDRFRSTLFERGLTWVPFSGTGASYRDNRFHDGGQTDRTIPSNSFSKFFSRSPLRITALELFHEKEKRENACGAGERGKRRRRGARRNEERSGTGRNGRETVRSRALSAEREGDGGETERERRALQRRGYASLRNYASFSGPYNCVIQMLLFPIRYILGSPSRFATLLSPFSFLLLRFLSLGPSLGPLFVYHSDEEDVGGPEISGDAQRADAHRSHSRCPLLGIGRLGLSG